VITVKQSTEAEALFSSMLQPSDRPSRAQIWTAIDSSTRCHGGEHGCAEAMAEEFGAHPEAASARMRWALALVAQI